MVDTGNDVVTMLDRTQDRVRLRDCIKELDEDKRATILLAYVEGYSQSQIAARLRTLLGTIKSKVRRGLMSLKECIR